MPCKCVGMHTSTDPSSTGPNSSPADAQLRGQLEAHMHEHGELDATKIGVVVRAGEVLLWGSVASHHERELAGRIAAGIAGSTAVINHIQVFRTTQS